MSWRLSRYLIVGIAAFVVGVVAQLPAAVVAGWVQNSSPLQLGGVTGTVFKGSAGYASLPSGGVDNLKWTLHPAALIVGHVSAHVRFDSDLDGFAGDVSHSLLSGSTTLDNIRGDATAGWLAKLGGYTFLPVSGQVALNISHGVIAKTQRVTALTGTLALSNTRWQLLDPPVTLGRFDAKLDHTDDGIRTQITDSNGPLALQGHAGLSDSQRYDLDLRLRSRAGADARLKELLDQLGKPDAQGWHRIREKGSL